jgi:broad specificity phosphatase PhoE
VDAGESGSSDSVKVGNRQRATQQGGIFMTRKGLGWILTSVFLTSASVAEAQQAIFLVRHGDTVRQKGNPDVPLSDAGERRAMALAASLKDSGITAIYTTGLQRTVKTAEPLAKLLGIEPKVQPQLRPGSKPADADEFAQRLAAEHRQDVMLVVLHSNSVPALLRALGHPAAIKIPETEFDNLFVIIPRPEGAPTVMRLRY